MRIKTAILALTIGAVLAGFGSGVLGSEQRKKPKPGPKPRAARVVKHRHVVRPKVVHKLPHGHRKMVLGPHTYWHSNGVFYRHGPSGYVVIRGPVGARVKVLHPGFRTVIIGGTTYHHYYGTYYVRDVDKDEYVVVEAPEEPVYADVVYLVDGETLEGTFVGGNEESIEFEVDGEVQEIPLVDIVTISFEPPGPEEEE